MEPGQDQEEDVDQVQDGGEDITPGNLEGESVENFTTSSLERDNTDDGQSAQDVVEEVGLLSDPAVELEDVTPGTDIEDMVKLLETSKPKERPASIGSIPDDVAETLDVDEAKA